MQEILTMMSKRIQHRAALYEAVPLIREQEKEIEAEFSIFMKEAIKTFHSGRTF
jgi:hypothetical protein